MSSWLTRSLAAALTFLSLPVQACTTFTYEHQGRFLFGRNYDYGFGDGMVVVNPRGLARQSALSDSTAQWTSSYGSVSFNQYGVGFPTGGINEAGLVVELMWHDAARYPEADDGRPVVATLEFIQHLLDRAADVDQALKLADTVRISGKVPIHFLVADRSGRTATIEFIDGKRVSHVGDALPVTVLANDTYADSVAYLGRFEGFGGKAQVPADTGSLNRFSRAATLLAARPSSDGSDGIASGFDVLDAVAQPGFTQWQLVYDVDAGIVQFRTGPNRALRDVDLSRIDFSCDGPARVLDIDAAAGNVNARFEPYTHAANQRLIAAAYSKTPFLQHVPEAAYAEEARFPQAFRCVQ